MPEKTIVPQDSVSPSLAPPPEGYRYVYNRMNEDFEAHFDGKPIAFKPHEVRMLTSEVAERIHALNIIPGTLRRGERGMLKAERAFALGPGWTIVRFNKTEEADGAGNRRYVTEYHQVDPEPEFMVPTETKAGRELFAQSLGNYVDRPSRDGLPTKREIIAV